LRYLGASKAHWSDQLHGVEIHESSAQIAGDILAKHGFDASIVIRDFFDLPGQATYDAVIGNPPFVRYQQFTGESRAKGLQAALAQGVRLTGLASSWAAFVIHGSRFLKPGGHLGLVLPAELLTVNYAAPVRRFLLDRFGSVRLVMFEKRVFPDVLEEVVLLLAEGAGGAKNFEVYQARDVTDLDRIDPGEWTNYSPEGGNKWTPALLSASAAVVYENLIASGYFEPLLSWGETFLGAVTGNNAFFCLTKAKSRRIAAERTRAVTDLSTRLPSSQGPEVLENRLASARRGKHRMLPFLSRRKKAVHCGAKLRCCRRGGSSRYGIQVPEPEAVVARSARRDTRSTIHLYEQ
jgi:adenine-specific DNA-methyltransferase